MGIRRLTLVAVLAATVGAALAQPDIPSSPRSREAVARVTPRLEARLAAHGLPLGAPVHLRLFKQSSELEVWLDDGARFHLFRTYPICSFSGDLGPKLHTGDGQSPEGFYFVTPGRLNPASSFHLSFDLGYPNRYDRAHGRTGRRLMVHGDCVSIGCYAMTDPFIEEIYTLLEAAFRHGQPFVRVHVFPFRLTDEAIEAHRGSPWQSFWRNLQQGQRWFDDHGRPPNVEVSGRRYVFEPDGFSASRLAAAAMERLDHRVTYDGSYRRLAYPGGDVPDSLGVCTDVVVRAYRALGLDLQRLVHEDMTAAFDAYPRLWGLSRPDPSIDHRRVPNLQVFFQRHGEELPVSGSPADFRPGDLVTWMLPGNLPHIGVVVGRRSADGRRPLIVHNIGAGPQLEDALLRFPITGHYRFSGQR